MKKALLIILLIPAICSVYGQTVTVKYPGYTSYWNPFTKIPDSVMWVTLPHRKAAKRPSSFHATGNRESQFADYAGSGKDTGHNCDARDEDGNKTDEYNSFDYINTFPQDPKCNRGVWLQLENHVRKLAGQYDSVLNKVYWSGVSGYIGRDSITVPTYCIKEIWYNGIHEKYIIPNSDTVTLHTYKYYKVE